MNKEKTIKLSPAIIQWIADDYLVFVLFIGSILLSGYEDEVIENVCLISAGVLAFYLTGRLWFYKSVRWEITRTQIKIIKGVLRRRINYVELYRVIDYAEEQSIIQQFLGLKSVYILSNDRTDPALRIFGIPSSLDIISEIKPLVKQSRIDNHIYEIAN